MEQTKVQNKAQNTQTLKDFSFFFHMTEKNNVEEKIQTRTLL